MTSGLPRLAPRVWKRLPAAQAVVPTQALALPAVRLVRPWPPDPGAAPALGGPATRAAADPLLMRIEFLLNSARGPLRERGGGAARAS